MTGPNGGPASDGKETLLDTAPVVRTGVAHVPTARNVEGSQLMAMLTTQQVRKIDLIVPAEKMKFSDGMLVIEDFETADGEKMILTEDGVTNPNGLYWPSQTFDDHVAERLDIAPSYLRRLRHGRVDKRSKQIAPPRLDLWDANVNGLLAGRKAKVAKAKPTEDPFDPAITIDPVTGEAWRVLRAAVPADERSFFLRLLRPDNGVGIARAMLSNRFARMDNIEGLLAMLQGIKDAGIDPDTLRIYGDLSETRMVVHVAAPQILAAAPGLLEGYRSPFNSESENSKRRGKVLSLQERIELGRQFREQGRVDGNHGFFEPGNEPLVHAGFLLSNSEVGAGRWTINPEITILQCSNGLTMTKDGFARNHVGSRQEDGLVEWSDDTQSKELALVTAQTRDVVKAVLSRDYLEAKVDELEKRAGKPVKEPEKAIEVVAKRLTFSKEEQEGILRHFLMGGQLTSGGVMNAVTSYSQTVEDPDAAYNLNQHAVEALELAFTLS